MNEVSKIVKNQEIIALEKQIEDAEALACKMQVTNVQEAKTASDNIGLLRRVSSGLNNKRLEQVKPFQDELSRFKAEIDSIIAKSNKALGILEGKYKAYIIAEEAKKIKEAEEARLRAIEEEKAKALLIEKDILAQAEKYDIEELVEQAIELNNESQAKIDDLKSQPIDVGKMTVRGQGFTTSLKDNWSAEIVDWVQFLQWIIKTERWGEMLDAKNLRAYAISIKKEGIMNGVKVSNNRSLSSRS